MHTSILAGSDEETSLPLVPPLWNELVAFPGFPAPSIRAIFHSVACSWQHAQITQVEMVPKYSRPQPRLHTYKPPAQPWCLRLLEFAVYMNAFQQLRPLIL